MRRRKILFTLSLAGLLMFAAYGCSSGQTADSAKENNPTAEAAAKADPTKTPEKEEKDDTADLKDTGSSSEAEGDEDDTEQTPIDEIGGEGTTDTTVPDLDSIESAPLKKEYAVTGESGAEVYTLTIDAVSTTDERDSNNPSNPENVVVIDYTYKNTSPEPLLIDDIRFKLVDGDTVYTPYYAGFLESAELIDEGGSCSAQLAFEVGKDFKKGTLVFSNDQNQDEISFELEIK